MLHVLIFCWTQQQSVDWANSVNMTVVYVETQLKSADYINNYLSGSKILDLRKKLDLKRGKEIMWTKSLFEIAISFKNKNKTKSEHHLFAISNLCKGALLSLLKLKSLSCLKDIFFPQNVVRENKIRQSVEESQRERKQAGLILQGHTVFGLSLNPWRLSWLIMVDKPLYRTCSCHRH